MLAQEPDAAECPQCGAEVAASLLSCPGCGRLVHAEALKIMAGKAEQAEQLGDPARALAAWRLALELLPPQSRQYAVIAARIERLATQAPAAPAAPGGNSAAKAGGLAGAGALAMLVWKFKFAAAFVLTKAKFLLLGLTKASTFFSMFLALGVYWAAWG